MAGDDPRAEYIRFLAAKERDEILAPLGRFTAEFERMMHYVRLVIACCPPLRDVEDRAAIVDLLVGRSGATAQVRALRTMLRHYFSPTDTEQAVLSALLKQLQEMVEPRNTTIHSPSFVDSIYQRDGEATFARVTFRTDKDGWGYDVTEVTAEHLRDVHRQAWRLTAMVLILVGWVSGQFRLEEQLALGADGDLVFVGGLPPQFQEEFGP